VRDLGGVGDLAVGQSDPPGAEDLLRVLCVGFAPATRGTRDPFERIRAKLAASARLAGAFGVGDRAERGSRTDRGAGCLGDPALQLVVAGGVASAAARRRSAAAVAIASSSGLSGVSVIWRAGMQLLWSVPHPAHDRS
jgi:hypothetical protein